jgi:hypothetical protein
MQFESPVQQQCYERIAGYLKELYGEFAKPETERPMWGIASGSTLVQIGVWSYRDGQDAYVNVWSWLVMGAERTPELMAYLLNRNRDLRFGAFGMNDTGDIVFKHSIRATSCDKEELRNTISAVMFTSDDEDEKIIARWGGRRWVDPAP